ncbi:MAG TPA: transporter associated domain-containing protein, partial [Trueperaceae bacterium]|nr:transporter associated domain-containing protein [Trueperaceae bacterium]
FDEDGDYDTLAGFLIDELGHIPEVGAAVVHAGMRFEVEQADGRRIVSVVATPVVEGQPALTDAPFTADAPAVTEVADAAIDPVARVTTDAQARVVERAAD